MLVGVCTLPGRLGDGAFDISTPVTGVRNFQQILVLFKYLRWCPKAVEDFVIPDYLLRYEEKSFQSDVPSDVPSRVRSEAAQPHRHAEVLLLQLLDEGHLSHSLLVRSVLHLVGHQNIIKCPLGWLHKDIPTFNHFAKLLKSQCNRK